MVRSYNFQHKQQQDEVITTYYMRWKASWEIVEQHFGKVVPTEIAKADGHSDDVAIGRLTACLFLGSLEKKHHALVDELNNQYLAGTKAYPLTVEAVVNLITHRMDHNEIKMKSKSRGSNEKHEDKSPVVQFAQDGKDEDERPTQTSKEKKKKHDQQAPVGGSRRITNAIWGGTPYQK